MKNYIIESFEEMELREELLYSIYDYGYYKPSDIQKNGTLPILKGKDVLVQAQSGTGKTATFSIGVLGRIDPNLKKPQILILSPTRELAEQSRQTISELGHRLNITTQLCIGGSKEKFNKGETIRAQIISGTPGRVLYSIKNKKLDILTIRTIVIDETDEMLSVGLSKSLIEIRRSLLNEVQTILVSATLTDDVLSLKNNFMTRPYSITVPRKKLSLDVIKQYHVCIEGEEWKFDALCELYNSLIISQAVIFCKTRKKVDWLTEKMGDAGFIVSSVHGEMNQIERDKVILDFRDGSSRVMITTDMWSRGIDVPMVSHVINYDLPLKLEDYIHRIGRSGRFGRKGVSINFVTPLDSKTHKDIEKKYSIVIPELPGNLGFLDWNK
eukprot:GHVP01036755.1.p1 GENE.GHVP01036755.1~~GHVP01036755.1.p1  ORF type:complete len:383 (-),score=67.10 GHVP01036755.1:21-1169(-)